MRLFALKRNMILSGFCGVSIGVVSTVGIYKNIEFKQNIENKKSHLYELTMKIMFLTMEISKIRDDKCFETEMMLQSELDAIIMIIEMGLQKKNDDYNEYIKLLQQIKSHRETYPYISKIKSRNDKIQKILKGYPLKLDP